MFNREKLTNKDVNCAIEALGYSKVMSGMNAPYRNKYIKNSNVWELSNEPISIRDSMKNLELSHFMDLYPINIEFDWLSIGGNIVRTSNSLEAVSKKKQTQLKEDNIEMRVVEDRKQGRLLVKEPTPNILSNEAEKFLNSFFRIIEEQVLLIDQGSSKLGYRKFLNGSLGY